MTNNLHRNYICVYHKLHNNILHNFLEKIELFFGQINNHTIKDDESSKSIQNKKAKSDESISSLSSDCSNESEDCADDEVFDNECNALFDVKEALFTVKEVSNEEIELDTQSNK